MSSFECRTYMRVPTVMAMAFVLFSLPNWLLNTAVLCHIKSKVVVAGLGAVWLLYRLVVHILEKPAIDARDAAGNSSEKVLDIRARHVGLILLAALSLHISVGYMRLRPLLAWLLLRVDERDADLKAYLVGEYTWQLLLTCTLLGVIYLACSGLLARRLSVEAFLGVACSVVYLCFLPWVVNDRLPLPMQPLGCPSPLYAYWMVYAAVICAACFCQSGDGLTCRLRGRSRLFEVARLDVQGQEARGDNDLGAVICIPSEVVAIIAAALSIVYLLCFLPPHLAWAPEAWKGSSRWIVYHFAWSYLRPAYTLLFAMYWLKWRPATGHPLYLAMCSFGLLFFGSFCVLADTHASHRGNHFCDEEGELHLVKEVTLAKHNHLGMSFHACEAMCFTFSVILYVWNGIDGCAWCSTTKSAVMLGMSAALISNCIERTLAMVPFQTVHSEYVVWVWTRYLLAYSVVISGCMLDLADLRKSPSTKDVGLSERSGELGLTGGSSLNREDSETCLHPSCSLVQEVNQVYHKRFFDDARQVNLSTSAVAS
eukprot:TRINITY_DN33561_c0_g1_i1.p1 TRINITY_DN33561_c0_g1~~TRINITY_DN33561_c0_g1_i1.p1  ORF type:complete len:539 (-),score=35.62 TRINITY_DN33561_c0_g1_i1:97-1713(-)